MDGRGDVMAAADVLDLLFAELVGTDPIALQRCAQVCRGWRVAARRTVGYCVARLTAPADAGGGRACVEAVAYVPPCAADPAAAAARGGELPEAALPRALRRAAGWPATIAAGCTDSCAQLWDLQHRTSRSELPLPPSVWNGGAVYSLAYVPSQRLLAAGCFDSNVRLWCVESRLEIGVLRGHSSWVNALLDLPGGWLASACADGHVLIHDPATRRVLAVAQHAAAVHCMAVVNGSLVTGSADTTLKVWRLPFEQETREGDALRMPCTATLEGHAMPVRAVTSVRLGGASLDLIASGGRCGVVRLWDPDKASAALAEFGAAGGRKAVCDALAWASGPQILAAACRDNTIRLWSVTRAERASAGSLACTTEAVATLRGHGGWVTSLLMTPQGQLASGSLDGSVRLWTVDSSAEASADRTTPESETNPKAVMASEVEQ